MPVGEVRSSTASNLFTPQLTDVCARRLILQLASCHGKLNRTIRPTRVLMVLSTSCPWMNDKRGDEKKGRWNKNGETRVN
jgi:hypothetical protein